MEVKIDNIVKPSIINALDILTSAAHLNAKSKGFWENTNQSEKIVLIYSELAEITEALRDGNPKSEKIPDFSLAEEEVADVLIRLLDFCGGYDYRIGLAVIAKMKYNESREYKHGKKF